MIGVIKGTGAYVPEATMDNNDIAELVETSDEWIRERTGVARRHIAAEDTTVSMAVKAAKKALENAQIQPEQIDMILVSTISPNVIMPCVACEVQKETGAVNAVGVDLSAACSGFVLAYSTACAYIESGLYKNILVIGSECLSRLTNWKDRGTCILFGDGAGAVVVSAAEGVKYVPILHSDGKMGGALTLASRHTRNMLRDPQINYEDEKFYMGMDGQAVFKFAVRKVPEVIGEVLYENHAAKDEITWYVLHQANKRIVEAVAKHLGEPVEKFPMNLQEYGNTSSASIPILLNEMNEKKLLRPGDKIIIAGFGGGLTWGAGMITWQ